MEITAVEKSRKDNNKMKVYVDGQYAFEMMEEDYIVLNLYEKKEITKDEIEHIKNTVNFKRAKSVAIRYLSVKLRSELEVRRKLKEKGFSNGTIDKVVEEVKALGYINDRMYVQKYTFDRSKLKPKSKRLIKLELINRGINEKIVDEVLADWKIDEYVVAEGLVRKKFGKYDLREEKIKRKVYLFLQHRGFNCELVNKVIRNMTSDK